jgi:hypothetical protein
MSFYKRILIVLLITSFGSYFYFQYSPITNNTAPSNTINDLTLDTPIITLSAKINKNHKTLTGKATLELTKSQSSRPIVKCIDNGLNDSEEISLKSEYDDYTTRISNSKNADDKFALLLQSTEEDKALDIFNFNNQSLHKALVYERKLTTCAQNFNPNNCNDSLYEQAPHIDKDNAYLWHLIANIHFSQNNIPEAIKALNVANSKAHFNNYYYETISFIEQNLQKNSAITFNYRLISGIGVASAKPGLNYSTFIKYCKENQNDINTADLCLQTGIQLEKSSKTLMASLIGLAIQEINYQHDFKTNLLNEIKQKRKNYETIYSYNSDYNATTSLIFFDEKLGRTWLNAGLAKGEVFSISQTINEAKTFSQDENYHPCQ